jgi:ubiquinone/menaquinone biosynthesis C-methylase UbiE
MATIARAEHVPAYLDLQATLGITKHNGGYRATDELLALCGIEHAREVLNVGCGIGVGSVHIARKHGCRVVGIDIRDTMVAWSRQRAREARVQDKTLFRVADVLDLPFEDNRFDIVFAESVLAFVDDKERALAECLRVARPGGAVGLNESFWLRDPSAEVALAAREALGVELPTLAAWRALWAAAPLSNRQERIHHLDARQELRDRMRWVGLRWALRAWGRLIRLYLSDRSVRQAARQQFSAGMGSVEDLGYGLFTGRK